jgi:hypothetical protein
LCKEHREALTQNEWWAMCPSFLRRTTSIGVDAMNTIRVAAIALIVAGILGLAYGGFSYTHQTQQAKLGPIELSVTERETVNILLWVGIGAIVIGGALFIFGGKRS